MKLRSPAKINLFLEVLGQRDDGYHDVETFMTAVSLFDVIQLEPAGETIVRCDHERVPDGPENLVHQAIRCLRNETGMDRHVKVTIEKRVPPGSGLGGGSSNAATVLAGLNQFASLSLDRDQLMQVGKRIGSDVNFFLNGPASICRGRGEKVSETSLPYPLHVILIIPDFSSRTPKIYEKASEFLNSSRRSVTVFLSRLNEGWHDETLFNRLYEPAVSVYPSLQTWSERIRDLTTLTPHLSGSGSAFFLAHPDRSRIREERERIEPLRTRSDVTVKQVRSLSCNRDLIQRN